MSFRSKLGIHGIVAAAALGAAALFAPATALADGGDSSGNGITQLAHFGDQSSSQSNDSSTTQEQGSWNLNIAPSFAIGGDAETNNAQGNGNTAVASTDQSNEAEQEQEAAQDQTVRSGDDRCCGDGGSDVEQGFEGGDQSSSQSNSSTTEQSQGNGNINIAPAIAIGGDAETHNAQGNGNEAYATTDQSNEAEQEQEADQQQYAGGSGSGCCDSGGPVVEQLFKGGDQSSEQTNSSSTTQSQGNENSNFSPALSFGGEREGNNGCYDRCGHDDTNSDTRASTWNSQGNGNTAGSWTDQSNKAEQEQEADQDQSVKSGDDKCCGGSGSDVEQEFKGGDQSSSQSNTSATEQSQGNGNVNYSPARAEEPRERESACAYDKCDRTGDQPGDRDTRASIWNSQGNRNTAGSWTDQSNKTDQEQEADQDQSVHAGHGCEYCGDNCHCDRCCEAPNHEYEKPGGMMFASLLGAM